MGKTLNQYGNRRGMNNRDAYDRPRPERLDTVICLGKVRLGWSAIEGIRAYARPRGLTVSAAVRELCVAAGRVPVATGGRRGVIDDGSSLHNWYSPIRSFKPAPSKPEAPRAKPRCHGKATGVRGMYTVTSLCNLSVNLDQAAWDGLSAYIQRNNSPSVSQALREICAGPARLTAGYASRSRSDVF